MKKQLDLRGLTCPEPVLKTKKVVDQADVKEVEALVDSEVSVQNLARLARSQNLHFQSSRENGHHKVLISKDQTGTVQTQSETAAAATRDGAGGTIIFISKDSFGQGNSASPEKDHDFSLNLLNVFLQTVHQSGHEVRAVLLANSGVKLMDPQSPHQQVLSDLARGGVEVLACGLCLDYYGLKEKVKTEQITNMFAICEYLFAADKVLSP
ncbi:MAG TPA: sulfurtransferase-like selenium metabolism protein YedF [Candidatus Obscuribacter sp.]|nr:sulfurtransferase-like selenium metabolism protein YedF [Candidatus Obscuribacter sp.]HNA73546.1 sulfurtransferase-like selenium metabolism protein YedF [Candidatus Obscuribacter sp.]HNG20994.1 sulfurtransferase-like selenium metabolism protein YedF [Candidatus Obscuribacter sp.]HNG77058.1 sulfurtransferase-like selenium metabolism protein YedF [Candidatus Obscuribacter sp.]HNH74623.1 sulfurtransferase-like selenium metabolism protein YedF [Candidatus Obscuribacter sp.]